MESESSPIIVRFKKLGRQRCLGEADLDNHTITIDPRQHSRELLGTLIHECIHLLADDLGQPELHENKVSEWEEKISRVLWDAGFRRIA